MKEYQRGKDRLIAAPLTLSAGGTNGGTLDTINSAAVVVRVLLSPETNTDAVNPTVSILMSDNTTVSNFVTVTPDVQVDNTAGGVYTAFIDKRNHPKRYVRAVVTRETTTNGPLNCAVMASLFRNDQAPDASTEWGDLGGVAV